MATYTININERTKEGKSILFLLRSLSSISFVNDSQISDEDYKLTLRAINDIRNGKGIMCKTFDDYKKCVEKL